MCVGQRLMTVIVNKLNRRAACTIEGRSNRGGGVKINAFLVQPTSTQKLSHIRFSPQMSSRYSAFLLYAHIFHGHNTRSRDLLHPPFAKTDKYQGSFRISGARTYNTIPRNIMQAETFSRDVSRRGKGCFYNLIICLF